jgi:hypothetical protein
VTRKRSNCCAWPRPRTPSRSESGLLRTVRIVGIATLIAVLFRLSQRVGAAWGNEEVGGYSVALGVVSLLFFVRAVVTEYTGKDVPAARKDILWGLSLGAFVSMVARLMR